MTKRLSRRSLLRGAGAALALPWLEAALPGGRGARAAAAAESGPLRLIYVYVPNGVRMEHWTPPDGPLAAPWPATLAPLEPFRDRVLVLSGLTLDKARANGDGPGDHARAAAAFLTAAQPFKSAGDRIHAGVSADQVAAQALGQRTRFRSLALGAENGRQSGECDSGYACVYSNNISYRAPGAPLERETRPRALFDRLFRAATTGADPLAPEAEARRAAARRSILDLVADEARALAGGLGAADRARLDGYLTAVRELERRLDGAPPPALAGAEPPAADPDDYPDHLALLYDILILALKSDSTRIATFMAANEGSNRSYPWLAVREGHHAASHHQEDAEKVAMIRRIDRFHVEQFARFLAGLAAAEEGDRTVLDRSLVVYGSGIADGNRHSHHGLPILLAGGGNGLLAPGRHLAYPPETPLANLHLELLAMLGVERAAFGDSTGRVDGLRAL